LDNLFYSCELTTGCQHCILLRAIRVGPRKVVLIIHLCSLLPTQLFLLYTFRNLVLLSSTSFMSPVLNTASVRYSLPSHNPQPTEHKPQRHLSSSTPPDTVPKSAITHTVNHSIQYHDQQEASEPAPTTSHNPNPKPKPQTQPQLNSALTYST